MTKMIKMCLNWKVIGGLALVAVGIGIYQPGLLGAALPILLLAVCPLSMLWMMRAMNTGDKSDQTHDPAGNDAVALRARMSRLAAEQEKISEELARISTEPPSNSGIPPTADSHDEALG